MLHIPYRGIAPAINDLLGGQTQAMFPGLAAALPHLRSGRMRALAVTGKARSAQLKDVPTMEEVGFKGFDAMQWYGSVGPAGMPADVVQAPERHAGRGAEGARPGARSSRAKPSSRWPMTPGAVRAVHPRRDRALDRAGQGAQHPARRLSDARRVLLDPARRATPPSWSISASVSAPSASRRTNRVASTGADRRVRPICAAASTVSSEESMAIEQQVIDAFVVDIVACRRLDQVEGSELAHGLAPGLGFDMLHGSLAAVPRAFGPRHAKRNSPTGG